MDFFFLFPTVWILFLKMGESLLHTVNWVFKSLVVLQKQHVFFPTKTSFHSLQELTYAIDIRIKPGYQEISSNNIPTAEADGVEVRILAGESMGVRSPVYTRTPAMYLDFTLKPHAQIHQNIPDSWNAFIYIIEGEGVFGSPNSSPVSAHYVLVLGPGDGLSAWNKSSKSVRFILVAGQPLNEPVVQYGPFVMNSQAEIDQTIEDYHYSKNGFEKAKHWRSQ